MSTSGGPLVTVIVTTFNHEPYIEQALTSVLEQETNFPYQVVVIEDCSTDGTRDLVHQFAANHPDKVRLALAPTNENNNRLFAGEWASSASEYVALLDGDDCWTSAAKLQTQVDIMEARPEYAFCFHDVEVVSEGMAYVWQGRFTEGFGDGVRVRSLGWLGQVPGRDRSAERPTKRTIDSRKLWEGCFVPGCSPLLRRAFLPELPQRFTDIEFSDWALYLLLGEHGPIMYVDEVFGLYRVHTGGLWSGLTRETQHQRVVTFFEQMLELLPRQESMIRSELERHRAQAGAERWRIARRRCIEGGLTNPPSISSLRALVDAHVPADSVLVWAEPALRPVGLDRRLLFFPPTPSRSWEVFGEGPQGQSVASWIAPGFGYEFRLERTDEGQEELAALTVVADRAAPGPVVASDRHAATVPQGGAYLVAAPNPATVQRTHASSEITWSTGNGSAGIIRVASYPLEEGMPTDDGEAIAILEQLRAEGGEFLFVPHACLAWLEIYPGLEQHLSSCPLVFEEAAVGRLYDLGG